MLSDAHIADLLPRIDVDGLGACPMCLFNAAWSMYQEEPPRRVAGAVTTAANWTWGEIQHNLRRELIRLRAEAARGAEEALADLDERGWRSRLVRRIVERLAGDMALDIASRAARERHLALVPHDS
jgi:hypothetical protein